MSAMSKWRSSTETKRGPSELSWPRSDSGWGIGIGTNWRPSTFSSIGTTINQLKSSSKQPSSYTRQSSKSFAHPTSTSCRLRRPTKKGKIGCPLRKKRPCWYSTSSIRIKTRSLMGSARNMAMISNGPCSQSRSPWKNCLKPPWIRWLAVCSNLSRTYTRTILLIKGERESDNALISSWRSSCMGTILRKSQAMPKLHRFCRKSESTWTSLGRTALPPYPNCRIPRNANPNLSLISRLNLLVMSASPQYRPRTHWRQWRLKSNPDLIFPIFK